MLKTEFSRALALAQSDEPMNLCDFMKTTTFDGFGLNDFEPVPCTLYQMAQLIAYHCVCFDGSIDQEAMDEIWQHRKRFQIVGEGSEEVVQRQHDKLTALSIIDSALRETP